MSQHDSAASENRHTDFERALAEQNLVGLVHLLGMMSTSEVIIALERLNLKQRASVYRLLPKHRALEVFEGLDATLQGDLVHGLQDEEVAAVFAELDPDDRVSLLDELPASVATRLLHGLPPSERELTAEVLGYPHGSIGRGMSPEYVTTRPYLTADQSLDRVRQGLTGAETVYTLPVLDDQRRLVGIVSLRDLMRAAPDTVVAQLLQAPHSAHAAEDADAAARRCAELKLLALPIVDAESRLVGILTVDDALRILEGAESEDHARIGGSEPLRRPYLSTPVRSIVRSRLVWLLVLAV